MNAVYVSSNLIIPPFSIAELGTRNSDLIIPNPTAPIQNRFGAVAERRMHFTVYEDDDGSSPFSPVFGHLTEKD